MRVHAHLQHPQPSGPVVLPERLVPFHVPVATEDVVHEHIEPPMVALDRRDELGQPRRGLRDRPPAPTPRLPPPRSDPRSPRSSRACQSPRARSSDYYDRSRRRRSPHGQARPRSHDRRRASHPQPIPLSLRRSQQPLVFHPLDRWSPSTALLPRPNVLIFAGVVIDSHLSASWGLDDGLLLAAAVIALVLFLTRSRGRSETRDRGLRERAEMSLETPSPSGHVFDRLTISAAAYPCPRANSTSSRSCDA